MDFEMIGVICAALLVYAFAGSLFVALSDHKRYALYLWIVGGTFGALLLASWLFIHSIIFEIVLQVGFWIWAVNWLVSVRPVSRVSKTGHNRRHAPEWR